MKALEILKSQLQGRYITRFGVGTTWDFFFDNCYYLVAQDIASDDEARINTWLAGNYPLYHTTVDKADIAKCAIVATCMQRLVTDVALDEMCNLTINFDGGGRIILTVDSDIVDWQWCLNKTGYHPYMDHVVACFWKGEVKIDLVGYDDIQGSILIGALKE